MINTLSFYDFLRWFQNNRPNNFSKIGLECLFDWFEELEEDTGEKIEFDGIAICCDFTEYDDLDEFKANYTCKEYQEIKDRENINYYTIVIPVGKKGFIIQNF